MKKIYMLIIFLISFIASRLVFYLIDDPEVPNLLIVTILAVIIFTPLLSIYLRFLRKK